MLHFQEIRQIKQNAYEPDNLTLGNENHTDKRLNLETSDLFVKEMGFSSGKLKKKLLVPQRETQ